MSSRCVKLGALLLACAAAFGATTYAADITISGVSCNNYNAGEVTDIDYLTSGVRNLNAAARSVVCPVPRSPLAAGAAPTFQVAGRNNPGTQTTCTLFVFDGVGRFVASQSFKAPASAGDPPLWVVQYGFPVGTLGINDDVSVLCTLPGGAAGIIYGMHSFQ